MEQGTTMQIRILDNEEKATSEVKDQGIEGFAREMDLPFDVIDE